MLGGRVQKLELVWQNFSGLSLDIKFTNAEYFSTDMASMLELEVYERQRNFIFTPTLQVGQLDQVSGSRAGKTH